MKSIARRITLGLLAVLPLLPLAAQAQSDWPNRPVRIIVAYPPGQSTDIATRYFANKLTQALGQSFFVENKPGASGNIGTAAAARATPDGYTLVMGANGIVVSNHGARQLDRAPSPLEVFPAIKAAVGDRSTLFLESGVRRGSDIVIARCLGAKFAIFGRPTLFGAAAAGEAGIARVIQLVRSEIDMVMAQIGCRAFDELNPGYLWPAPPAPEVQHAEKPVTALFP